MQPDNITVTSEQAVGYKEKVLAVRTGNLEDYNKKQAKEREKREKKRARKSSEPSDSLGDWSLSSKSSEEPPQVNLTKK